MTYESHSKFGLNRREFLHLLAGSAAGAALLSSTGCGGGGGVPPPKTTVLQDLTTRRSWITFAPPRPYDPSANNGTGIYPDDTQLRSALSLLYAEGWRNLVTYTLDGTLSRVPALAKDVGFSRVIAGLFWFDAAQLSRERAAALAQNASIDAFALGNEGLQFARYTRQQLETELAHLKADTGKPVVTTEPLNQYLPAQGGDTSLLNVGDWVFLNIHPWLQNIRNVSDAVTWTHDQYQALQAAAPAGRSIVVKETWWPTIPNDASATEFNQSAYFQQLAATNVKFVWGEAYDEFWKSSEGPQGPHWGLHTDQSVTKTVINDLRSIYTGQY